MIYNKIEWRHENTRRYPYLGYFSGCIVLFDTPNAGTLIYKLNDSETIKADFMSNNNKISNVREGNFREDWKESNFKIFTGEITLCNATT